MGIVRIATVFPFFHARVSRTLVQIYHEISPTPSAILNRALLTNHVRDSRCGYRVLDGEDNYFGFGVPSTVLDNLECKGLLRTFCY